MATEGNLQSDTYPDISTREGLRAAIDLENVNVSRLDEEIAAALGDMDEEEQALPSIALEALVEGRVTRQELEEEDVPNMLQNQQRLVGLALLRLDTQQRIYELQETYRPHAVARLAEIVTEISPRIDFDAFVEHCFSERVGEAEGAPGVLSRDLDRNLEGLIRLRQVEQLATAGELQNQDWQDLFMFEEELERCVDEWSEQGFVSTEETEVSAEKVTDVSERREALRAKVERTIHEVQTVSRLKGAYRKGDHDYRPGERVLERLARTLDITTGYHSEYADVLAQFDVDPRYLGAVGRFFNRKSDEYIEEGYSFRAGDEQDQYYERCRGVSREEAIAQIDIQGLEIIDGYDLVMTEAELRDLLALAVPAVALGKIRVVVASEVYEQSEDDPLSEQNHEAKMKYDESGELESCEITICTPSRVRQGGRAAERAALRDRFETGAVHEAAHVVLVLLDPGDLAEWERIMDDEVVDVTTYVSLAARDPGLLRQWEDFCESYMLFVKEPRALMEMAPQRYNFMITLLQRYMGDEPRDELFRDIEKRIVESA